MKDTKLLRGQIRQVVKEILPEVLNQEQYAALKAHVDSRLTEVEKYIKETMDLMNTRQKEVLKYLLESYLGNQNPDKATEEPAKEQEAAKE